MCDYPIFNRIFVVFVWHLPHAISTLNPRSASTKMATRMLWLAQAQRERFSLRLNDDCRKFHYRMESPRWEECDDGLTMSNGTATIRFDQQGSRMHVNSVPGFPQVILLANTTTNMTIGVIKIDDCGAVALKDSPIMSLAASVPVYWTQKTTAIIGINGSFTANLSDKIGCDEDIIRLKPGQAKIFRPNHWILPTPDYDSTQPVIENLNMSLVNPSDVGMTVSSLAAAATVAPHATVAVQPTEPLIGDGPITNNDMNARASTSHAIDQTSSNVAVVSDDEPLVIDQGLNSDDDDEFESVISHHSVRGGHQSTRRRAE